MLRPFRLRFQNLLAFQAQEMYRSSFSGDSLMDAIENKKERRSLRQKVYEGIMQEIVTCKLRPGESISELQFVERFQVSKTPIREALTALQKDGLVHYTPEPRFHGGSDLHSGCPGGLRRPRILF